MRLPSFRYRLLFPVKTDNMLWWASLLMFIGAMGFNISNIAAVLVGDVPLDLSTSQEVGALLLRMRCVGAEAEEGGGVRGSGQGQSCLQACTASRDKMLWVEKLGGGAGTMKGVRKPGAWQGIM